MNFKKWLRLQKQNNIYDFKNKSRNVDLISAYMFDRTQSMFVYDGLPKTIPARVLELYLQINGNVCIAEVTEADISKLPEEKRDRAIPGLYPFTGGMGGELDAYYMPTIYTVANPYLNLTRNYNIDVDCVVIPSDSLYLGLLPMFEKYGTLMVENELSINLAQVNARASVLLSAADDATKKSAEKYLQDLSDGSQGIISDPAFLDGVRSQPYASSSSTNVLQGLIELEQYLKATWFNELGLNANYNMKRESLNSDESQMNNDALLPLVDDMLKRRREGMDKVNAMFGTHISVNLASSWEDNEEEIALEHAGLDEDADLESEENNEDSVINDGSETGNAEVEDDNE